MEHRSAQLKVSGEGAPEVTKLQNGRYRLEFRCTGFSKTEDWYYENVEGKLFADFGSLMDAEMLIDGVGGAEAVPASVYPDMRLVENSLGYTSTGAFLLYFAYETLTDTFVQVKDDNVDYELNGLRRVTRTSIAKAGVDYQKVVGTSTISHQVDTETAVALYLASYKIDDNDAARTVTETWVEAGLISESINLLDGGLREVSRVSFYDKNAPTTGILVQEKKDNYNGYPIWSTTTIQTSTGGDPTTGTAQTYTSYVPFTYPGIANCIVTSIGGRGIYDVSLDSPVTADVEATVEITYQSSASIGALPYTFWNPSSWAKMEAKWLTNNLEPTSVYRSLPNYRVGDTPTATYPGGFTQVAFLGKFVYALSGTASAVITLSGGPVNPAGGTYVIQRPTLDEAFVDVDGTKYYRKTIIYATIPAQT